MTDIYVYDTRAFTDAKSAAAAKKLVWVGQFDIGSESYLLDLFDAITATEKCLGVSWGVCRPYLDCSHKDMSESFIESYGYGDGSVYEFNEEKTP